MFYQPLEIPSGFMPPFLCMSHDRKDKYMTMKTKAIILVILVLVFTFIFVLLSNRSYRNENKELLEENIVKSTMLDTVKQSFHQRVESEQATDEVVSKAIERTKDKDKVDEVIQEHLKSKLNEIDEKEKTISKQIVNRVIEKREQEKALEQERSQAYIDSVWESYCLAIAASDTIKTASDVSCPVNK